MEKGNNLDAIQQERSKAEALLADILKRENEAKAALAGAGRPVLLSALKRVKIGDMGRSEAKAIADAIAKHGGAKVAAAMAEVRG